MSSTLLLEAFADDCANVSNLFFLDSRLFEISATKIVTSEKNVPHVHVALPPNVDRRDWTSSLGGKEKKIAGFVVY